jgi:sulfatase maturation enzyme AslB (radical SAM superfamily)
MLRYIKVNEIIMHRRYITYHSKDRYYPPWCQTCDLPRVCCTKQPSRILANHSMGSLRRLCSAGKHIIYSRIKKAKDLAFDPRTRLVIGDL